MTDATLLLSAAAQGEPMAAERLLVLVYNELRSLAGQKMARERAGQTLQPTALVHEAWLRLIAGKNPRFENRAHFFAAAAEAMRRILIERARRKLSQRHGDGREAVEFNETEFAAPGSDEQMLEIHEALDRLEKDFPRHAELVKLRYFAGLTIEETSELLGISLSTAKNYWAFARTWLFREIRRA
jgi:RNA polymerase sigma factor (TIGR02999 family)